MSFLAQYILSTLLLATGSANDDLIEEAYSEGASWASSGISAKCMLAVTTDQTNPVLKTPEGRAVLQDRAQRIAGLALMKLRLGDEFYAFTSQDRDKYVDYYENGLLTEEDYQEQVVQADAIYADMVESVADLIVTYKDCNFFRGQRRSETLRRAILLLATRNVP